MRTSGSNSSAVLGCSSVKCSGDSDANARGCLGILNLCLLENYIWEANRYKSAWELEPSSVKEPGPSGLFSSAQLKVGPLATSGSPHVLIMCWQWLLLLGWLSQELRVYPESRQPAEVSGRDERREHTGGSCLGDSTGPRSLQGLPRGTGALASVPEGTQTCRGTPCQAQPWRPTLGPPWRRGSPRPGALLDRGRAGEAAGRWGQSQGAAAGQGQARTLQSSI